MTPSYPEQAVAVLFSGGDAPGMNAFLRAIVRLGHGLSMTVTAEGIETQRQLSLLRDIGCDLAQGYLLGRPAALGELAAIILRNFAEDLTRRPRPARRSAA